MDARPFIEELFEADEANPSVTPYTCAAGVVIFSALLVVAIWVCGLKRARALRAAEALTRELRASEKQTKHVAERLAESERDYRELFERAHDAIIVFSPEDEIVREVNERACEMYGFSREEFMGMSLREISENNTRRHEEVRETLRKGAIQNFESYHYRKDGSLMAVEINASVVQHRDRRVIVSINRDITWRKNTEAQLVRAARHEALVILAESIAHEFNSMLASANVILKNSAAPAGSSWPPDDKVKRIIQQAQDMAASLLELLSNLDEESASAIELNRWLPERLNQLASILPSTTRIQFRHSDIARMVRAEPFSLEQVLRILLTNASDALSGGGDIEVSVSNVPVESDDIEYVEIRIADQGEGVLEGDRQRLFEPFFTTRTRSRRSGLGLVIASRLIEQLGGSLRFEPNHPNGSIFVIRLRAEVEGLDEP